MILAPGMVFLLDPWSSAAVAYSSIRPKSQIFNIRHDYALWIRNFMVMMKKPENLDFETCNLLNKKILLPISVAISNFLVIVFLCRLFRHYLVFKVHPD
jgi:hypothetical protein